ncbi:hypothetical protein [Spirobacillus cienkowskii]|uniref:hypothetical protein n=1 Tax=Spirobacillus cienkowskii TaxID=495820 RepID=UPI0030D0A655
MFQYQCMFIGSILALLLTNISCNIKDDKNSKYSGFDPNLKRNKREIIDLNNTKISFQYEHIPSGTCSTYQIISPLDNINQHLELIDKGNNFTLDRNLQKLCAYKTNNDVHRKPAPIHSKAQLVLDVLDQGSGKIFAEIEVTSKAPSITEIMDEFPPKNLYSQDQILKKSNSFYVPAGGNPDNFKIVVYDNSINHNRYLISSDKIYIVGKHIESEYFVRFSIKITNESVDPSDGAFFSFEVPSDYPHGRYDLSLRVNEDALNVERPFTIYVVEKDKNLNSPEIKSINVVYNNTTTTDISIPIGTCVDYKVIATDLNDKKYDITGKNWYTVSLAPAKNFTLFPEKRKICAYNNNYYSTPRVGETTMFIIKYQKLIHDITLNAVASPEFILKPKNPISEEILNVKAGSKTTNFKINLVKFLDRNQNSFANNAEDFEILDEDKKIIKLNSNQDREGSTSFNFKLPYIYDSYDKTTYSFTLRMKRYPNIKETFSVNVTK